MVELKTENIERYLYRGRDQRDWYETEARKLINILPEFAGLPIIRIFAVTSMATSIEANVHQALKALLQIKHGERFIGYLPVQETYLNLVYDGRNVPGRKIQNFINALEGDENAVVVDRWMCKAFDVLHSRLLPDGRNFYKSPTEKEYTAIENYVQQHAAHYAITPREFQSMLWAGIKREQGFTKNVTWSSLLLKKKGFFNFI
jgi:hypothetical protein